MKSRLVFDTNALVSAALAKKSITNSAFRKAIASFSIVTSVPCFDELAEVILRPKFRKYLELQDALEFIDNYKNIAHFIPITCTITDCRDPKDNKFLELALSAQAQFIVTGDIDLLILDSYHSIKIISPALFLNIQNV